MSISALEVIERLPYECQGRLEADLYFLDIPIVVADEGNVEAEFKRKQAVVTSKSGKAGIAVIVLQVVGDDEFAEVKFGPLRVRPAFQVLELREINRGPSGTKKSARQVARRIIDVMKSARFGALTWDFVPDKPCLTPISAQAKDGANYVGYQVNFWCVEGDAEPIKQMAVPSLARSDSVGGTVALSCADAGAEIYYTEDDSYPNIGNPNAKLYSTPIAVPVQGLTLRFCAYAPGTTGATAGEQFDPSLLNVIASAVDRAVVTYQT